MEVRVKCEKIGSLRKWPWLSVGGSFRIQFDRESEREQIQLHLTVPRRNEGHGCMALTGDIGQRERTHFPKLLWSHLPHFSCLLSTHFSFGWWLIETCKGPTNSEEVDSLGFLFSLALLCCKDSVKSRWRSDHILAGKLEQDGRKCVVRLLSFGLNSPGKRSQARQTSERSFER